MRRLKLYSHLMTIFFLTLAMGCVGHSVFFDPSHVPLVDLQGDALQRYQNDVRMCQQQVLKLYEGKTDTRNQDREFRECLIKKGYVLLSWNAPVVLCRVEVQRTTLSSASMTPMSFWPLCVQPKIQQRTNLFVRNVNPQTYKPSCSNTWGFFLEKADANAVQTNLACASKESHPFFQYLNTLSFFFVIQRYLI